MNLLPSLTPTHSGSMPAINRVLTGISLFSGAIDGLAIAFEMAGIHVTHHVEYDAFCCANLRRLHPNATVIEGDIRQLKDLPYADVIFGGPPCQGFSEAGTRNGFADPRYLWPEMFRLVKNIRPRCVLVENVRGATSGDNLIDAVLSDLESIDYTGAAFLIPACLFGAPHKRYRLFIVAYTSRNNDRRDVGAMGHATTKTRQENARHVSHRSRKNVGDKAKRRNLHSRTQPNMGRITDGATDWMDRFDVPDFPAAQGIYQHAFEPPRTITEKGAYHDERIKALGNAVVWQQAHPFALAIAAWLQAA